MKTKDGIAHVSYNSAKKTFVSLSNTRGQYLDKCLLLSVWYVHVSLLSNIAMIILMPGTIVRAISIRAVG